MNKNVRGMLIFSVISIFVLSFAPFTAIYEDGNSIQVFFNGRSKTVFVYSGDRDVDLFGPEMFGDEFPVAVPVLTLIGNIMMILTSFVILIVGSTYLYYSIFMTIGSGLAFTGTMLYIEFGQIFTDLDMYFFVGFYYCAIVYGISSLRFLYGLYHDLTNPKPKRSDRIARRLSEIDKPLAIQTISRNDNKPIFQKASTTDKKSSFQKLDKETADTTHLGIITSIEEDSLKEGYSFSIDEESKETSTSDEDIPPKEEFSSYVDAESKDINSSEEEIQPEENNSKDED